MLTSQDWKSNEIIKNTSSKTGFQIHEAKWIQLKGEKVEDFNIPI